MLWRCGTAVVMLWASLKFTAAQGQSRTSTLAQAGGARDVWGHSAAWPDGDGVAIHERQRLLLQEAAFKRVIIVYKGRCLRESALGLQGHLEPLGVQAHVSSASQEQYWEAFFSDPNILFIVFGANLHWNAFPRRYIVVQMEQAGSEWLAHPDYRACLCGAIAVWDFASRSEREYAGDVGVPTWRVPTYVEPHVRGLAASLWGSPEPLPVPPDRQPIDVLFFGDMNDRRHEALDLLKAQAKTHHIPVLVFHSKLYEGERDELTMQAKVVLNLHFFEDSSLEVHRLNYLMALGKCVVSEHSSDPSLDQQYAGVVVFAERADIPRVAGELVNDNARRFSLEQAALALSEAFESDTRALAAAWQGSLEVATRSRNFKNPEMLQHGDSGSAADGQPPVRSAESNGPGASFAAVAAA